MRINGFLMNCQMCSRLFFKFATNPVDYFEHLFIDMFNKNSNILMSLIGFVVSFHFVLFIGKRMFFLLNMRSFGGFGEKHLI